MSGDAPPPPTSHSLAQTPPGAHRSCACLQMAPFARHYRLFMNIHFTRSAIVQLADGLQRGTSSLSCVRPAYHSKWCWGSEWKPLFCSLDSLLSLFDSLLLLLLSLPSFVVVVQFFFLSFPFFLPYESPDSLPGNDNKTQNRKKKIKNEAALFGEEMCDFLSVIICFIGSWSDAVSSCVGVKEVEKKQ